MIAQLCDEIRLELERKDLTRYVNSILTAYVVKTPPDHEAGLGLLLHLRGRFFLLFVLHFMSLPISSTESEPQLVEDAVKYIIFLVDANSLFDTALGMYDFSLVLMIAQHAQKVRFLARVISVIDWIFNRIHESICHSSVNCGRYRNSIRDLELTIISGAMRRLCIT